MSILPDYRLPAPSTRPLRLAGKAAMMSWAEPADTGAREVVMERIEAELLIPGSGDPVSDGVVVISSALEGAHIAQALDQVASGRKTSALHQGARERLRRFFGRS